MLTVVTSKFQNIDLPKFCRQSIIKRDEWIPKRTDGTNGRTNGTDERADDRAHRTIGARKQGHIAVVILLSLV